MRLLLDTNVIIPLEDSSRALEPHVARLTQLASSHNHQLLAHPASRTDIRRDQDITRRAITESRLARYPILENPPRHTPGAPLDSLDNNGVDRELLYAVERDAVAVLITEDRGIHSTAAALNLAPRVLYVQQAVSWLERLHAVRDVSFPNIRDLPIHNLNLHDPFFDSLRAGYAGFDSWFQRSARDGRKAWVYLGASENPKALCIYKREESPTITDDNRKLSGGTLKLCTFKVAEEVRGRRIGELFFKAAFKYAHENALGHVYLTMIPDQVYLRDLCMKYGFEDLGPCSSGREIVLAKRIPQIPPADPASPLAYHIKYSPCFKVTEQTQFLLVPIQPRFHEMLFPEISSQFQFFTDPTIGNGLTLAYLCHAQLQTINPGDIVLFYRSGDLRRITTIGVVEATLQTNDVETIVRNVAKRTVYAYDEIQHMADRPVRVILFRLATHLPNGPEYETLRQQGIVNGPIQSITRLPINAFREITQIAGFQGCFFAD